MSTLKKVNQFGYDHVLLGVAFIVIIGVAGTYYLLATQAQTPSTELEAFSYTSGHCLDNYQGSNSRVDLYPCNNRASQAWTVNGTIKSASGYCLTSSANAVLGRCNGSNSQRWRWVSTGSSNHQLQNVASGKCLDVYRGSSAANTTIDMYSCKNSRQGPSNQEWFERSQASSNNGGGNSGGGTGSSGTSVNTNPSVSQCPNAVKNGVTFSTSTPAGEYSQCILAIQYMLNGVHANAVLAVVDNLKGVGTWAGGMSESMVPRSGIFDAKTAQDIKYAQQYGGISQDGVVGPSTLDSLCYFASPPYTLTTSNRQYLQEYSLYPTFADDGSTWAINMFGQTNGNANCPKPLGSGPAI